LSDVSPQALASGPVIPDKLFWLTSIDRTRQRGVSPFLSNNVEFTAFNVIKKEPFDVMLQTHKLDWNISQNDHVSFRFSRDGNQGRAGGSLVENQRVNRNGANQLLSNWTHVFGPKLVSDFRIQFQKYSNYYTPTPEAFAMRIPRVAVRQSNVTFGLDDNSKPHAGANSRAGAASSRVSIPAANKKTSRETNSRPGRRRLRSLIEYQRWIFCYQSRHTIGRARRSERTEL